jgi:hypothetical protein
LGSGLASRGVAVLFFVAAFESLLTCLGLFVAL